MAALALAAALVVPASPAQAAEEGEEGGLVEAWEQVWQWVAGELDLIWLEDSDHGSYIDPNGAQSHCEHGSYIDPNG